MAYCMSTYINFKFSNHNKISCKSLITIFKFYEVLEDYQYSSKPVGERQMNMCVTRIHVYECLP